MAKDFGSGKGGVQKSTATEASPKESGTPKTGFSQAPKGEVHQGEVGPGVPANTRKIK